jgi:uncharacterized membrane protein
VAYRRLPGRARRRFGLFARERGVLWLASDHLLHVRATAYSETCKCFDLRDIQTLTISKTGAGAAVSIALAVAALAVGMPAITLAYAGNAGLWAVSLGSIAGILALLAVISVVLGPTCKCRLYTAVQVEELPSLGRLRTAHRTVALLRAAIEEAQGRLTPEALDTAPPLVSAAASARLPDTRMSAMGAGATRQHEPGNFHAALFAFLTVLAVLTVVDIVFQHRVKDFFDGIIYVVVFVLCTMALRRQRNTDVPDSLQKITWASLVSLILLFGASLVYGWLHIFSYSLEHAGEMGSSDTFDIRSVIPISATFCTVTAVLLATLGLAGLILLRTFRNTHAVRRSSTPPEAASEPEV